MDMENLMAQARELQDKVAMAQDALANTTVRGISGNGDVIVSMTGKYDLLELTIKPEIFTGDCQIATQLIMGAFRDAKAKADEVIDTVMSTATAGMPIN